MKKKRHTSEQVIQILRKAEGEKTVEEVCRESNISEQTFYRWRRKYGRMKMSDLKRFKELEKENTQLKKMLADEMLKIRMLEETLFAVFKGFLGFLICCLHLCTSKNHYALGQMRDTKTVDLF